MCPHQCLIFQSASLVPSLALFPQLLQLALLCTGTLTALVLHLTAQYVFSIPYSYHQAISLGRTWDHIAFQFCLGPTGDHCHNFLTDSLFFYALSIFCLLIMVPLLLYLFLADLLLCSFPQQMEPCSHLSLQKENTWGYFSDNVGCGSLRQQKRAQSQIKW